MKQKEKKKGTTFKKIVKKEQKENLPVLNLETVKKYINPLATDQEAYMFLQLCKSQKLNPFIKEAYLIKYSSGSTATMVVGKDVFTKRAHHNPLFDGYKAGVIVRKNGSKEVEQREGSFYIEKEESLLGAWCTVYRKDRKEHPTHSVSFNEYAGRKSNGELFANWKSMPGTMIRKVALVQALREAFPDDFQGLYDVAEMKMEQPKNEVKYDNVPQAEKNITPKKDTEVKQKTYTLPKEIKIGDKCNLGAYKDKPIKYIDLPLDQLLLLRNKAENPKALDNIISYVVEGQCNQLVKKLQLKSSEVDKISMDLNKEEYINLDWQGALKVLRALQKIKNGGGE